MRWVSITLALAGLGSGLTAAWQWYKSSRVVIDPHWSLPGTGGHIEPVIPDLRAMDLQVANDQAFQRVGHLNSVASLWTATSVILNAASAIAAAFSY